MAGVLVALDGVPCMARLLGVEPRHEALHALWLGSPSVVAHETGRIDAETFAAGVVADLGLPTTPAGFLREFRAWPTGLLPGTLALLDEIPRRYPLAVLSNTSEAHWSVIREMGLEGRFAGTYLSHQIGYLKPDPEAFQTALKGMGLAPAEVLFLDDSSRNVEAARRLGMHAQVVKGPAQARQVLAQYGVVPTLGESP